MYLLMVTRQTRRATGATERYAPRIVPSERLTVSGPFASLPEVREALQAVLTTQSCLGAQIWTEEYVREERTKGYSRLGEARVAVLDECIALLAAAAERTVDHG